MPNETQRKGVRRFDAWLASDQARPHRERVHLIESMAGEFVGVREMMYSAYVAGMEAVAEAVGWLPEQVAQEAPDAE